MDEVERKSVMLDILYEDKDILVVVKPAGVESQTSRRLEPDMVSEIKNYLHRKVQETKKLSTGLSPKASTAPVDPYVGVIHRLDKPVRGVMVYAKNLKAAAHLSRQVQEGKLEKIYQALVCGKPVDNVGNFVDKLSMNRENNYSRIVDNSDPEGKTAELSYRVIGENKEKGLTLVEIHLKTGRHHQIRVQFAGHGLPLWGDAKYNPAVSMEGGKGPLALAAVSLSFTHPVTKEPVTFSMKPQGGAFRLFPAASCQPGESSAVSQ